MKRWKIFLLMGGAVLLIAEKKIGTDLSELEPVQVLSVVEEGDHICLYTDTGRSGVGANWRVAAEHMNQTADKQLFLDTAAYLLVTEETACLLPELADFVHPTCRVCLNVDGASADAVAAFLMIHSPQTRLAECNAGAPITLEKLRLKEGTLRLER